MAHQILLIDSNRSHADALRIYLERQCLEVEVAGTAEEVLFQLDNNAFDIILGNPYLENGSTIPLIKTIKESEPLIQIIVYASKTDLDRAMDDFDALATNYLETPLNSKALDLSIKHARKCIATEKKLANYSQRLSDLHNAQNLYQQLFDEVPCYISVQDRELRLTATNSKFKKDFGNEIGDFCYSIYKHRSSPCPKCPVAETFHDGKSNHTEEIVTSKSGRQYNVVTQTAPIRDEDGNITQVMEMSTNITQIRQLQDHLSSLGLMLGSMSHGVKGMLTALDGGIYQLESGLLRDDKRRVNKAFEQIKQMADRIKKMVLEILYYAKSRELQYQTMDVTELANTIAATVRSKALKNGIQMDTDIPESLGRIDIDPNWMQAALVNFLENAVDACSYDTSKKEHCVEFKVWGKEDNTVCFSIKDNGMGIDQETREKMFTLFFTSKGSQGTGLGLFIANHVVEHHGGSIDVESEPDKGTAFIVLLPRKKPDLRRINFSKDEKSPDLL